MKIQDGENVEHAVTWETLAGILFILVLFTGIFFIGFFAEMTHRNNVEFHPIANEQPKSYSNTFPCLVFIAKSENDPDKQCVPVTIK